jgi:hypothetical protein
LLLLLLLRLEKLCSQVIDPTPQPFANEQGASSVRVDDLRAELLEAQQQQQQQGASRGATQSSAPPSRDFVKSRAESLASALSPPPGRFASALAQVGGAVKHKVT